MDKEEIIRVEYEAIRKFSKGDKQLAYRVVYELSPMMRDYINACAPRTVTADELCEALHNATRSWTN